MEYIRKEKDRTYNEVELKYIRKIVINKCGLRVHQKHECLAK